MTDGAPTLQDVARDVLRSQGATGRDLDRKAKAKGLRIAYTTINAMVAGTYTSKPTAKTVEALAALSHGFTREQVFAAARIPLPRAPLADRLPEGADSLLPEQEEAVLAVIRQFAFANGRLLDASQEPSHGAPTNPAGESPAISKSPAATRLRRAKGVSSITMARREATGTQTPELPQIE